MMILLLWLTLLQVPPPCGYDGGGSPWWLIQPETGIYLPCDAPPPTPIAPTPEPAPLTPRAVLPVVAKG